MYKQLKECDNAERRDQHITRVDFPPNTNVIIFFPAQFDFLKLSQLFLVCHTYAAAFLF